MSLADESELDSFAASLRGTGNFVYANSHSLMALSVAWFLAALPIVTIGPATLGAYIGIRQLRSDYNRIDRRTLLARVRERVVPATLFALFPLGFLGISLLYFWAYAVDGQALSAVIFFVALYIALYGFLVMMPTFVRLSEGEPAGTAIRDGISWVAAHPTLSLLAGLITVVLFVVTLALTIAFVLIFAGAAFSYQIELVTATEDFAANEEAVAPAAVK